MDAFLDTFFDVELMLRALPDILREGLRNTVVITLGAVAIGLVAGMFLALLGISTRWWVRLPARVYIDIFRGLPAILTIIIVGQGLPQMGLAIFGRNRQAYGILALGLIGTAYIAEIFRSGIQSVEKGQMEAARSIGMSYLGAMSTVVIPQGIRRVLPALTNEFIALLKDSSLLFVIGMGLGERDVFRVGQNVAQRSAGVSPLVMAGIVYLAITVPLTRLVNVLDTRLREGKPGETGDRSTPVVTGGHEG